MLMIACLILAIKTRKLPEGMNDSREIMYCSFTSFIIWLAFVPLYAFSTTIAARVISLCVSLFIHATAFLSCLFLTKIYIVVFRPEKNNKDRVMRSTAASPSKTPNTYSGNHQNNGLQSTRKEEHSNKSNDYTVEYSQFKDDLGPDNILSTDKVYVSTFNSRGFQAGDGIVEIMEVNKNSIHNSEA
ncbi:metabotropic glutamate receptor-like [Saccostrea echinata]|uniref:metabotropic glutamate receptor-like n=1 Tax=Saccostrea echinata TaxID=191078 RepID=UPI002A81CF55|nr:metabotropic glutamate receptor-like [Saccostrea echinata]